MGMRWVFPAEDAEEAAKLVREMSMHPVCARILVARGMAMPAVSALLHDGLADLPDPLLMKGMDRAVERIELALRAQEPIALWGDYDVDGVTSTSLLASFLREVGAQVTTYIPHRVDEGYGLNTEVIERLAASGTRLLVALDCGISALGEIERAGELGLEVLVLDHHQVGASLPQALAILDPHQPGCGYPDKNLCAAGVAFLLTVALRRSLRQAGHFSHRPEPNLRRTLDLVALGTIADVVPLTGANRILARYGLMEIAAAHRPGIRALKVVSGFAPTAAITAGQVAFRLAPRINAVGRLADAAVGVELLTTSDPGRAEALARELDEANGTRQAIEKRMLAEAVAQAEELGGKRVRSLVLASESWHPGVVGIVAARIVERFHRPTFAVALQQGEGRGSGRSIEGFHLFEALKRCQSYLKRFGGHKHAAGLTVDEKALPHFRQAFEKAACDLIPEPLLSPSCRIDAVVSPGEIDASLAAAIEQLAPFGAGNPEPVLASLKLTARPRIVPSKIAAAAHLKLSIDGAQHLDVIGFGLAAHASLASAGALDAAFHLGIDDWNGARRLSLRLKDLRRAE
jgi:single-stranded-DNA-specific exonuclease